MAPFTIVSSHLTPLTCPCTSVLPHPHRSTLITETLQQLSALILDDPEHVHVENVGPIFTCSFNETQNDNYKTGDRACLYYKIQTEWLFLPTLLLM